MKRLRWKKDPRETGLRSVGARPRSSRLWDGEIEFASVNALGGGWHGPIKGWYWVVPAQEGIPYQNHCHNPISEAEAKAEAAAYIKACLAKHDGSDS